MSTCSCDCSCISCSDCSASHPSSFAAPTLYQFDRFSELPPLLFLPQPSLPENKEIAPEERPTSPAVGVSCAVKPFTQVLDQANPTELLPNLRAPSFQSFGVQVGVMSATIATQCFNGNHTNSVGVVTDLPSTRTSSSNTSCLVAVGATQTPWQDWELLWQHRLTSLTEAERSLRIILETSSAEFLDQLRHQLDFAILCCTRTEKMKSCFSERSAGHLLLQITSLLAQEKQQRDALECSESEFLQVLAQWKSECLLLVCEGERQNCRTKALASELEQQKSLVAAQRLELSTSNAMMCMFRKRIMQVATTPTNRVANKQSAPDIAPDDVNWMSVSVPERFAQATSKARQLLERNDRTFFKLWPKPQQWSISKRSVDEKTFEK